MRCSSFPDGVVLAWKRPARKRPAVLVVYYDGETGVGLGAPFRDYGWKLAQRGFVGRVQFNWV